MPIMRITVLALACVLIIARAAFAEWLPGGTPILPSVGFGRYVHVLEPDPNGGAVLLYADGSIQPTIYSPLRYVRIDREGVTHTTIGGNGSENKLLGGFSESGPIVVGPSTTLGPNGVYFSDHLSSYGGQFMGVVVRPDGSVGGSPDYYTAGPIRDVEFDGVSGAFLAYSNGVVHVSHMRGDIVAYDWTNDVVSAPGTAAAHTPRICSDNAGGAYVAWEDSSLSPRRAFLQHLDASGQPAPGWPAGGMPVATGSHLGEYVPDVAPDGAGGVYVGWLRAQPSGALSTSWGWWHKLVRRTAAGAVHPAWPDSGLRLSMMMMFLGNGSPSEAGLASPDGAFRPRVLFDGVDGVYCVNAGANIKHVSGNGTIPSAWGTGMGLNFSSFLVPNSFPLPIAVDGRGGLFVLEMVDDVAVANQRPALHNLTSDGMNAPGWTGPVLLGASMPDGAPITLYCDLVVTSEGWPLAVWTDSRTGDPRIYASLVQLDAPVAVEASLVSVEAEPNAVRLSWHLSGGAGIEPALERREPEGVWAALARLLPDGNGRVEFEDRAVRPGASYDYRLVVTESGVTRQISTAHVLIPQAAFTLAARCALPSRGDLAFEVSLPASGDARLELIDVTGRRVADRRLNGAAAGKQEVRLGEGSLLPPGVYTARLAFAGQSRISRVVIAR